MGRGIKTVELNERDLFVLFLLDKFRVLDGKSLTILAGFPSESYCSTRLQKLAKFGYIKREKLVSSLPLVHYLTVKGNDEINDKRTKHQPRLATLEHELYIGQVASYLWLTQGVQPKKIITDRELRQYERQENDVRVMEHKGDLLFFDPRSGTKTVVEIELSFKGKGRTAKNVRKNSSFLDRQLWFIRKSMRGLEKVLLDQGLKQSNIFYLESLDLDSLQTDRELDRDFTGYSAIESIRTLFNRTSRAQASQEQPQAQEQTQEVEDKPIEPQEKAKSSFFNRFR